MRVMFFIIGQFIIRRKNARIIQNPVLSRRTTILPASKHDDAREFFATIPQDPWRAGDLEDSSNLLPWQCRPRPGRCLGGFLWMTMTTQDMKAMISPKI